MKIIVLDGYTLNPGDLSWDGVGGLGDLTVHDRTPAGEVAERAEGAEIVLTNKTLLPKETIEQLPAMKYVGVLATGYNVVDVAAAKEKGVIVTNVPLYGTASVAQMTFAHLLNLTQRVAHHAGTVREGRWTDSVDFCYWDYPMVELAGLTMGIIGLGRIGRAVAKLALAFGMNVLGHDVVTPADLPEGVTMADVDEIFGQSDVVSLHCPLTADNEGMVNGDRLAMMKPTAFLINTGRGPLVDSAALADALNAGQIAGAALDVLAVEPPPADEPLLQAKNCFVTPHIAWATRAARQRLMNTVVDNIKAFQAGEPINVVN